MADRPFTLRRRGKPDTAVPLGTGIAHDDGTITVTVAGRAQHLGVDEPITLDAVVAAAQDLSSTGVDLEWD